jgi:hypothetical protein
MNFSIYKYFKAEMWKELNKTKEISHTSYIGYEQAQSSGQSQ